MPNYSFTFKKDDILVEFTSQDKDVVEKQFQIWVANADEYAKRNTSKAKQIKIEPQKEIPKQPDVTPKTVETNNNEHVLDKASDLLKTINTIQDNQNNIESENNSTETEQKNNFDSVLEEKIENSDFEPVKTKDPIFLNFVNSKNTTDKFHYLIITAYYLSAFEKLERFSLKQINAKLMQNLSEVIDHSMLQEAINQSFMEVVPDLTGVSDVAEYRLTNLGEDFFANRI